MINKEIYDILIIGGGPAAFAASIYAKMANMKVAFIEKNVPGGKIVTTHKILNYPGCAEIDGPDLAMKMFEQTQNMGIEFLYGNVVSISKNDHYWNVKTDDQVVRTTKTVIIASGMNNRKMDCPGEKQYNNKGISYCAVCDGSFVKNKIALVSGGGNSALQNAMYLSTIAKEVIIVHRRDEFRASESLVEQIKNTPNIKLELSQGIKEIKGDGQKVTSVDLISYKDQKVKNFPVDYIFVSIGFEPNNEFIQNLDILNDSGFIEVDLSTMATKVPGIYAAGDIINKRIRQITSATNDGTIAALSACSYIKSNFKK